MKSIKLTLAFVVIISAASSSSFADDSVPPVTSAPVTKVASAIWQAEANKITTNDLTITPMRSLQFKYAPGQKNFVDDSGSFEIAIQGDHSTSTDFKLEARVDDGNNVLRQVGGKSTLRIGAYYGSTELGSSQGGANGNGASNSSDWTPLIDSSKSTGEGRPLWNLVASAGGDKDAMLSARDSFKFYIAKATSDGTKAVTDISTLPDAMWQGEVAVAFRATWSQP